LATLQVRRELRKTRGLVKFTCGVIESRKASVEEVWAPVAPEKEVELDDDEDEQEGGDSRVEEQTDEEQTDEDEEDDENEEGPDDDEDDDDEPQVVLSGKQKRKRAAEKAAPPRKKVSFGPDPKTSKQARSAGSLARRPTASPAAAKEKHIKAPALKKDRKVANTAIKTKPTSSQKAAGASGAAGEEYDFGKFF